MVNIVAANVFTVKGAVIGLTGVTTIKGAATLIGLTVVKAP